MLSGTQRQDSAAQRRILGSLRAYCASQILALGPGLRSASGCALRSTAPGKGNFPVLAPIRASERPAMAEPPMLAVEGLDVFYRRAKLLHGVSFSAQAGEIVALPRRNGAGKSTTLKAVIGHG